MHLLTDANSSSVRQYIPHPACYVGREFFLDRGGFDESFPGTAADQEFFVRVCETHPPEVWIRFLADFMIGGVSGKETTWSREALWHKMRVKNGVLIANNRLMTEWLRLLSRTPTV